MDLNKCMLIGRLTRDPEMRSTANGAQVASFAIATNLVWKDQNGQKQEKVEFHNIVAWRRLAEICGQYLKKGAKVYVEGRIQTREYTDQQQQKRFFTEIVMENMIMLDSAQGGTPRNNVPQMGGGYNQSSAPNMPNEQIIDENVGVGDNNSQQEDEIQVENIPF